MTQPVRYLLPCCFFWMSLISTAHAQTAPQADAKGDTELVAARAATFEKTFPATHPRLLLRESDLPAFHAFVATLADKPATAASAKLLWPPMESPLPEQPPAVKNGTTEGTIGWSKGYQVANDAGNMALRHALAWLASGDARYGREAARWLMHLASWKIDREVYRGNDELFIQHLRPMIFAYDWAWTALTPEERGIVGKAIEARLAILAAQIQPKFSLTKRTPPDNSLSHPMRFISTLGQGGIALFQDAAAAPGWAAWAYEYYLRQFPVWGGDAGGWSEGLAYWSTGTTQHVRFLECMKLLGFDEPLRRPFFRNTAYFGLYGFMPYSGSSFGDLTNVIAPNTSVALLEEKLGLLQGDPYPIAWAQQLKVKPLTYFGYYEYSPIDALLHQFRLSQQTLPAVTLAELPQSRYFDDIGVVTMHSRLGDGANDIMLGFRSSPQGSASHAFSDQNSFVLNAFGEPLAISSGYREYYDSPHHKGWTRTTAAKNAILFNGEGQAVKDANAIGRITRFAQGPGFSFVSGDATRAYGGRATLALRHIFFVARRYFVMLDEVEAPQPIHFQWQLHAREAMQIDAATASITEAKGKARLLTRFLQPAAEALSFRQTDAFNPPVASSYEKKMPNEWHVTAETRTPERRQTFLTTLQPYRAGEESTLPRIITLETRRGWALKVAQENGGTNELVLIARDGEKEVATTGLGEDDVALRGMATSVSREANRIGFTVVEASELRTRGLSLQASAPLSGEGVVDGERFSLGASLAQATHIEVHLPFAVGTVVGADGKVQAITPPSRTLSLDLPAGPVTVSAAKRAP